MSGGSFDYLCYEEVEQLRFQKNSVFNMSEYLIELGYDELAKETEDVFEEIKEQYNYLEKRLEAISPVWKAVEWYDSCDWGIEEVEEAVSGYKKPEPLLSKTYELVEEDMGVFQTVGIFSRKEDAERIKQTLESRYKDVIGNEYYQQGYTIIENEVDGEINYKSMFEYLLEEKRFKDENDR